MSGTWVDDKREGKGHYTYKSGGQFEGVWQADSAMGDGRFTDANGGTIYV